MSTTTAIDAMANQIGFDIALSTDQAQADLLNGLARGFKSMERTGNAGMQLHYAASKFTPEALAFLEELGEVAKHERQGRLTRA
jgi:hypothetical protein